MQVRVVISIIEIFFTLFKQLFYFLFILDVLFVMCILAKVVVLGDHFFEEFLWNFVDLKCKSLDRRRFILQVQNHAIRLLLHYKSDKVTLCATDLAVDFKFGLDTPKLLDSLDDVIPQLYFYHRFLQENYSDFSGLFLKHFLYATHYAQASPNLSKLASLKWSTPTLNHDGQIDLNFCLHP